MCSLAMVAMDSCFTILTCLLGKLPQMIQNLVIIPFVSARWYKPPSNLTVRHQYPVAAPLWLLSPLLRNDYCAQDV